MERKELVAHPPLIVRLYCGLCPYSCQPEV